MKAEYMNTAPAWLSMSIALLISACGGGESIPNAPAVPVLNLTFEDIKTFHFSWADVTTGTEYRLLEDPDSVSGFTQIATIDADQQSYDLAVFLPERINARYILQACNEGGCNDSGILSVNGTLVGAIGYIKASNTGAGDQFGISTALAADGNTLAVGAILEDSDATGIDGDQDNDSTVDSGAVYVFVRDGLDWSQQSYIKASNTGAGDQFGSSLALADDGDTLVVGAAFEDSNATGIDGNQANDSAGDSGAVYVFVRDGADWSQQAYIKASNTGAGDQFGRSIALGSDGNTLAAGAVLEDSNATGIDGNQGNDSADNSGAVYVFTRSGANWNQQAYIKASNTGAGDQFGRSVAIASDGDTLCVGAFGEASNATGIDGNQADNSADNSGAAYVFVRSGASWSQQAYVKASNTGANDFFGVSIALAADGGTLAVGAYFEDSIAAGIDGDQDDNSSGESGAVYVYIRNGPDWSQQAYVKASNSGSGDQFGRSVTIAGSDILAAGAYLEAGNATGVGGSQDDDSAIDSGAIYLY